MSKGAVNPIEVRIGNKRFNLHDVNNDSDFNSKDDKVIKLSAGSAMGLLKSEIDTKEFLQKYGLRPEHTYSFSKLGEFLNNEINSFVGFLDPGIKVDCFPLSKCREPFSKIREKCNSLSSSCYTKTPHELAQAIFQNGFREMDHLGNRFIEQAKERIERFNTLRTDNEKALYIDKLIKKNRNTGSWYNDLKPLTVERPVKAAESLLGSQDPRVIELKQMAKDYYEELNRISSEIQNIKDNLRQAYNTFYTHYSSPGPNPGNMGSGGTRYKNQHFLRFLERTQYSKTRKIKLNDDYYFAMEHLKLNLEHNDLREKLRKTKSSIKVLKNKYPSIMQKVLNEGWMKEPRDLFFANKLVGFKGLYGKWTIECDDSEWGDDCKSDNMSFEFGPIFEEGEVVQ